MQYNILIKPILKENGIMKDIINFIQDLLFPGAEKNSIGLSQFKYAGGETVKMEKNHKHGSVSLTDLMRKTN